MDNARHRQILRVLRPHGADRLDPEAQPALAAAQHDPTLSAWLEREQAFDRGFAERIQSVTAPPQLREAIFASLERANAPRPAHTSRPWLIQRPIATAIAALAAAASLALLGVLLWPSQVRSINLEAAIAAAASTSIDAHADRGLAGRPLEEIRDWLAARSAPVPGRIPAVLAALPTGGAGVVDLGGATSSLVVFEGGAGEPGPAPALAGRIALFTLSRQSCSTAGITREPAVREHAGRAVAVWRDATSIYVVTADAPADALRRFLGSQAFAIAIERSASRANAPPRKRA